jgi:competence protein ComEA
MEVWQLDREDTMKSLGIAVWFALSTGIAGATVNLNTATKDELVALSGIGPAKAQAILDYRAAHGPFKTVEQLKDVKGIGAKRFEKLKPELTVSGAQAKAAAASATGKSDASMRAAKGDIAAAGAKRDAAPVRAKP